MHTRCPFAYLLRSGVPYTTFELVVVDQHGASSNVITDTVSITYVNAPPQPSPNNPAIVWFTEDVPANVSIPLNASDADLGDFPTYTQYLLVQLPNTTYFKTFNHGKSVIFPPAPVISWSGSLGYYPLSVSYPRGSNKIHTCSSKVICPMGRSLWKLHVGILLSIIFSPRRLL